MNRWQKLGLVASTAVLSLGIITEKPVQAASFEFIFQDGNEVKGRGSLSFTNSLLTGIGEEYLSVENIYEAENINFKLDYPISLRSGFYIDYDLPHPIYGYILGATDFYFTNGRLSGLNLTSSDFLSSHNDNGSYEASGQYTLLVKNNRFTTLFDGKIHNAGYGDCNDGTYYDEDIDRSGPAVICEYNIYDYEETNQIQEEGISYQIRSVEKIITVTESNDEQYYYYDQQINEYPNNSSGFIRYDQMPQIKFTTLEPINPTEPIPEPFTIVGTATAMAFGVVFKKAKKRKD